MVTKADREYEEIIAGLRKEIVDLNVELRKMKRQNTTIDIKFMDLYRVLQKVQFSDTHKEAVGMATSILKGVNIDHSVPVKPTTEPVKVAVPPAPPTPPVPPPDPQKHKRGPKTKDSKSKRASLFSWIF